MLNQEQIKGKWNEIKGGVRNLWGEITDDELDQTKGNIQAVSGIVQQKYGETKESIKKKLDSLMDSFDNETDKSLKLNDGEASYQRNPTSVRTSATSEVQDELSDPKTRSSERSAFESSQNGATNAKQGIAGNQDNQPYPGGYGAGVSTGAGTTGFKEPGLHGVDDVRAGGTGVGEEQDDDYDAEEIFDESEKDEQTYEAKKPGRDAEDRIARH